MPNSAAAQPLAPKPTDLEIKDAHLIFSSVWQDLEANFGRAQLRFPKEIILLGGAPGAGKGTNTEFIKQTRMLTCAPIVVSALLDSPEARALKNAGIDGAWMDELIERGSAGSALVPDSDTRPEVRVGAAADFTAEPV